MKAESPGPSVGKLVPKIRSTARILYVIYFVLTIIEIIFLAAGGMPVFEAINTSTATAGTGGFGVKNDSLAGYSAYIQWVVTIFMILFGVNFNAYYLILFKQFKKAFTMEEVVHYFAIILIAIAIIFTRLAGSYEFAADALRDSAFQVASIITTTGFSTADFDKWPAVCQTVLVFLMFIGACAGSTGGGIKVSRLIILRKTIIKEMTSYIHPKSIKKLKMDDKPVEHEVVRATNVFFITFVIVFSVSVLLIAIDGNDLVTNFTAVAATINNIGPGLSMVGPTQNFSHFSIFSKYILMFDMIAGRLELFPLLMLFHPELWKEMFVKYTRRLNK
jgi:trk system potassium uptake protein TrkH